MGFQTAKRTERKPPKVFLQFANVMPTQAHIMSEISRALKVSQMHVIKFLAKMLLRLQHLKPDGLELRDDRINFLVEIFAHGRKRRNNLLHRATRDRLKVVFFPDFNVKNAHFIYPAADLSEQISTAGKEASGTGNMKFSLNGALTIGTLDGANVEIREEVSPENFFLFGLNAAEVGELKSRGYRPRDYYEQNATLREAIDFIASGALSRGDAELFRPLIENLLDHDPFLLLADYQSYIDIQERVSALWRDPHAWTRRSILNTARMGKFSSDRSIRDYCERVWKIEPGQR